VTGSEVAVDLLMQNKDKMRLSDIYITVAGSSMVLSKSVVCLQLSFCFTITAVDRENMHHCITI